MTLVNDNMNEMNTMGVVEGYIGMNSCRKGVSIMFAAGFSVSPPIVSNSFALDWGW